MSLILTIDIGDGRIANAKVSKNTDLNVLISRLSSKFNLNNEAQKTLIEELKQNSSLSSFFSKSPEKNEESTISTNNTVTENKTPEKTLMLSTIYENPGEKLYDKGLRYMEIISSKVEKLRKLKLDKEQQNLTFSPKINPCSFHRNVENLLSSKEKTDQKLEKLRGESLNSEIIKCTFTPSISKKSVELAEKRRITRNRLDFNTPVPVIVKDLSCSPEINDLVASTIEPKYCTPDRNRKDDKNLDFFKLKPCSPVKSVFDDLYEGAKQSQEKKKAAQNTFFYSHKPDISETKKIDEKLLENRGKYKRISDSRKEIMNYLRIKATEFDLSTGQKLFRPLIKKNRSFSANRASSFERCLRSARKPISKTRLTSFNSAKIIERIKYLRFKSIFEAFSPINNFIYLTNTGFTNLSRKIVRIITPLIEALKARNSRISFDEFQKEMEDLLKKLTPEDRNDLIKGELEENTRCKSAPPARKSINFDIYERGLAKIRATQEKLENHRKIQKELELEHCTFTPTLKSYRPSKPYAELWKIPSAKELNLSSIY